MGRLYSAQKIYNCTNVNQNLKFYMKSLAIMLLILVYSTSFAQKIHLKPGQQFIFEYFAMNNELYNVEYKSIDYQVYQFDVSLVKDTLIQMKVQMKQRISFDGDIKRLNDTSAPQENPENDIKSLTSRVMSTTPLSITVNSRGEIIQIIGLKEIHTKVLRQAAAKRLPESKDGQKNEEILQSTLSNDHFQEVFNLFFNQHSIKKLDTVYSGQREEQYQIHVNGKPGALKIKKFLDTISINKETNVDLSTGLTTTYISGSINRGLILNTDLIHRNETYIAANLKSTNIKSLATRPTLLALVKQNIDMDKYYSRVEKMARVVDDLKEWHSDNKGKLGIDEIVTNKLDSINTLMKETDYTFWASEVELMTYLDNNKTLALLDRLPAEHLKFDASLASKASLEYNSRNAQGFVNALKLMFTKFAKNQDYPINAEYVADLVHRNICKDVIADSTTSLQLLKIQEMIDGVLSLKIKKLSSIFQGIKQYITAKLASNQSEIEAIAKEKLSFAVFDNYSRYRLLIYDRMTALKVSDSIRTAYLDYSIEMFRKSIEEINLTPPDDSYESFFFKYHVKPNRILLRKHLADAYYRKSILEPKNSAKYLQIASDYLPNQQDKIEDNLKLKVEYTYLPEVNYTELFINASGNAALDPNELLKRYVDMVIIEPERYTSLKSKYQEAFPSGNFSTFFSKTLKEKLPASPAFRLKERSGVDVSSVSLNGKFTFIDFWGTWCGACVLEIDKIEELYIKNPLPQKLNVTTIACFDKKNLIDEFMQKKQFTYQVLISDNKVEKDFKIISYPTKILILPNDVYLILPHSEDYITVIKKYITWEF